MWNLPPPPGFNGLREDQKLEVYIRHLPHWRQEGATYFVTFRLADSLPQVKLDQLATLRAEWEQRHPPPWDRAALEMLAKETMEKVERWLDQGMGSCVFQNSAFAGLLAEAMHHFDGVRYELDAYVVMPNHAHALVRPTMPVEYPLESILGSWKQYSSTQVNRRIGSKEVRWQEESYDRIVRDEEHLYRCLQYIGRNPRIAGLDGRILQVWVRPEWIRLGWRFEV
jgi:putative transposase